MTKRSLGNLTATTGIDRSGFQRDRQQLLRDAQQTRLDLSLRVDTKQARQETRQAIASLKGEAGQALTVTLKAKLDESGLSRQAQKLQGLDGKAVTMKFNVVGADEAVQQLTTLKTLATSLKGDLNLRIKTTGGDGAAPVRQQQRNEERAAAAEERRLHQEGMQRLRDRNATVQLNARLAAQSEKLAQDAINQTIRALENQQRSMRNSWVAGKMSGMELVDGQRQLQARALEAAKAFDKQSDAYRRMTQVAAAAQNTMDRATGKTTPGSLGHSVTLGIQNSGLFNQLTALGGPAAQSLGIVASSFHEAKKGALEFGNASNTAATAAGFMAAGMGGLALAAGGAAMGLVSLGKVGLEQVKILEKGLNTLEASGVKDLEGFQTQVKALKEDLGKVGKSLSLATLTASAAELVKANLSASDSLVVLAGASKLAAAEGTNLNQTSAQLLMNTRQYNLEVSESGRVADMFAKAGNLAAGTANDLSLGFGKVGGTGLQAGIEMNNLLGMLVELDLKGMSAADTGADALRTALSSLADITEKGQGILKEMNIAIDDASGKARPAGDIMADLGEKMRGMGITVNKNTGELQGNGEALRTVAGLMDTRAAAAVINLTGDWREHGKAIKDSEGYATEYANTMSQGVEPAQRRLKTAFEDTGLAFAKTFAGPLATFLDTVMTPMVTKLGEFFTHMSDIKNLGEVIVKVKLEAGDDNTTQILKILAAPVAIPLGLGGQAGQLLNVDQLQKALIRGGILEQQRTPWAILAQFKEVANNYDKYLKLATERDAEWRASGRGGLLPTAEGPRVTLQRLPEGGNVLTGQGPLMQGQVRAGQEAAGKWTLDFISGLADVFRRDSRVASDCAIVAYEIMSLLGGKIVGTAKENAWVPTLEKNAKASGYQQISLADAQAGDLVIFKTGNGNVYSPGGSGMHAGVIAGRQGSTVRVIDNPGTQSDGVTDGITRVRDIGGDARSATVYRAPTSPYARAAGSGGAVSGAATTPARKSDEALLAEAKRILDRIEATKKGNDIDGWNAAREALKAFQDSGPRAAAAVELVRGELGKTTRTTSEFGKGFDDLEDRLSTADSRFKLSGNADQYAKSLTNISRAAQAAAEAEKKARGETDRYRALLDLAGDAAGKARQQREALARDEDQAADERTRREEGRARALQTIAQGVQKGKEDDYRRALETLKNLQADELAQEGLTAAQREKIIARTSPAILKAAYALNAAIKKGKDDEAEAWRQTEEAKALTSAQVDAEVARRKAENRKDEREANLKAQREQREAVQQAGRSRVEEEKQLAAELRDLKTKEARATASRLKAQEDGEVARYEGDPQKQLELIKRHTQAQFEREEAILRAERKAAEAAAKGKPNEEALKGAASAAYLEGVERAKQARIAAIRAATRAVDQAEEEAKNKQDARDKEQRALRNRLANERRDLDVATAEAAANRLKELNRQQLDAFRGTTVERLALIEEQAQAEYDAAVAVADVRRRVALEKSANEGGPNQVARDAQIEAEYTQAELTARGAREAAIRQATEQQTRAAQEQQRLARENEAALRTVSREGLEGRLSDAEAARDRELAAAEGNLAEQLRIETERGAEVLALQRRLAEVRRNEEAASLRAQAQQKKTTNAETFKGDPARIAAEDAKVDTWLTGALGNLQSRFYAQIGKVEAEAAARLTRSGEALTAAEEQIATDLLEQREQTLQTITESTTALFNSGADFEEQARGRADAIGTVAGAIRELTGLRPDQATLDDLADLPTLYDRIMQAGLDLEGMDLTSLEALSELLGGFVSRDRDFLPVEQARAFAAALEAAGGSADELREALAMPEGDRTLVLNARQAIQSGDTDVLTGVMESLAGRDLKSSPALANLRAAVDAALATLGDQAAARARRAMEATWEGQRGVVQGEIDALERRAPQMDEGAVIEERARLQADLASLEWETQETRLYAEDATNEEIAVARAAFGRRLAGIEQTRADAQAALTLRRAREVEDARAALELQALDNRAALGLMGEEAHQQERERLQLEAAARQRDRAIRDAGEDAAKVQAARDAYALAELQVTGQQQARARQAQIDGARATQDALLHEQQTGLEVRKAQGLVTELQAVEESGRLQLEARKVQRDRELQDAKGNWDLMLAALRRYNADKAQIEAQTAAETARIRLELQRSAEDAATSLAQAKLDERIALGQLSARDAQQARERMELDAAERAHARAVADAKGDADRIKAADLALEAERTRIRTQGATDRRSIALDEADWEIAQAQRRVDRSGGVSGNRALQTALARKLELTRQQLSEITDQDSPEYIAALGRMQAAEDALTEAKVSQINVFGNYAQQLIPGLVGAMQVLGGVGEEVAQGWGESLGNMVGDLVNFATLLAKGDYVGAAIAAFTSIFTGFARQMAEVRAELKRTEEYGKQFRFNADGYGTRQVTHTKTGFLWWAKNVYTEEIDELGKTLALSFENAVVSGVQSGFAEAVAKGDASILEKSITTNLKDAAFQGLTEAFLNSAGVAALLGPLVQKLMEAFKSGNKDLINQALADFKAGVASMRGELDALVETGQAIEGILDPEAEARRQEEAARDLADRRLNTEETLLDLLHTRGLISTQQYERRKLDLELARIRARMEADLAAEGLTEEQKQAIRDQAVLDMNLAQAQQEARERERVAQQARDLARIRLESAERENEAARRSGEATWQEYEARRLELALERIEQERQEALSKAELTAQEIAEINRKYDQEAADARNATRDDLLNNWSASAADGLMQALESGDLSNFGENFEKTVFKATAQGLVAGLAGDIVRKALAPLADEIVRAFGTPGTADDLVAVGNLKEGLKGMQPQLKQLGEALKPLFDLFEFGSPAVGGESFSGPSDDVLNSWVDLGRSAFVQGLEAADFSKFFNEFRANLTKSVLEGVAQAAIGDLIRERLRPLAARYQGALATAGTADDLAALRELREGIRTITTEVKPIFDTLRPEFESLQAELRANTDATRENTEAKQAEQFQENLVVVSAPPPKALTKLRAKLAR